MKNPIEIFKMITNPEKYVRDYAKENPSPIMDNLIKMAENNNQKGVEQFAENVFKEQGKDLNNIISNLK